MHPNNYEIPGHPLIVFGTPKTASSSVKKALALSLGVLAPEENARDRIPLRIVNRRLRFHTVEEVDRMQTKRPELWSMTTVREPLDRFISLWDERVRRAERGTLNRKLPGGLSSEEFAQWLLDRADDEIDHHARSQASAIAIDGRIVPRHVMRFERLAMAWNEVQGTLLLHLGVPIRGLEHVRRGRREHIHLSERCIAMVQERYACDYELLGYKR